MLAIIPWEAWSLVQREKSNIPELEWIIFAQFLVTIYRIIPYENDQNLRQPYHGFDRHRT
jgi:hypothetical protein